MGKPHILIQLDCDRHASSFDRVVAVDADVDALFSYGGVREEDVEGLTHGAMFTRGPNDLESTAFFIGGSDVELAERLFEKVTKTFFGPLRCSVLFDAAGSNSTASAAVLAARRHVDLAGIDALVTGGTGPVGQRVALLLAKQGARVSLGSRSEDRAEQSCQRVRAKAPDATIEPIAVGAPATVAEQSKRFRVVISAGAAGARILDEEHLAGQSELRALVDLNAVPPTGIAGVEAGDNGRESDGVVRYGALGVGGTKMRIHKAAIRRLFESNDQILDAEELFEIGLDLERARGQ